MLDKLIDLLLQFIDDITPFVVIPHYDRGVRLRFGKQVSAALEPGFYWKVPFADNILTIQVKMTTMSLAEQTVTTKDGQSMVVKCIIKYEIEDAAMVLLEMNDPIDSISDMAKGIIRKELVLLDWKDCNNEEIEAKIKRKVKAEAKKWGISISEVTLTDLGLMRSIRILNSVDSI
jgi:membrane protease subunit HflC